MLLLVFCRGLLAGYIPTRGRASRRFPCHPGIELTGTPLRPRDPSGGSRQAVLPQARCQLLQRSPNRAARRLVSDIRGSFACRILLITVSHVSSLEYSARAGGR